jgi:glycosyltransferase involved in cell wall biosynthesis
MTRFNIITNLANGVGLQREYEILRDILIPAGHAVTGVDFQNTSRCPPADVNLFLETVVPSVFSASPENWVMPNPEWWHDEYQRALPAVTRVLCKTHHAYELFRKLAGDRACYVGFMSRDLYQADVERKPRFLHLAGNSQLKNTEAILKAWKKLPYRLTVVSPYYYRQASKLPHVKAYERVSDDKLRQLMNSRQFHLCPSKYEGFGHYIHEAMGVGAVVVTSDGPPMNELSLPKDLLVPTTLGANMCLARLHEVTAEAVIDRVRHVAKLSSTRIQEISRASRAHFEQERSSFRARILEVVNG